MQLWKTGVLGAPSEYWSYPDGGFGKKIARRLKASSHADYLAKIIARRTSNNGVFGVKALFSDFRETLARVPEALNMLRPAAYIYVDRLDRPAHAAELAKSMQVNRRFASGARHAAPLRYDRDEISKCLGLLERERLDWMRWFESNDVEPLVVSYEDMAVDSRAVVNRVVEHLGVQDDQHEQVRRLPEPRLLASRIGGRWAARFEREIREGVRRRRTGPRRDSRDE